MAANLKFPCGMPYSLLRILKGYNIKVILSLTRSMKMKKINPDLLNNISRKDKGTNKIPRKVLSKIVYNNY